MNNNVGVTLSLIEELLDEAKNEDSPRPRYETEETAQVEFTFPISETVAV